MILEARISQAILDKVKTLDLTKLSDEEATQWLSRYSQLYGGTPDHGFQHIIRGTQVGIEHFFSKDIFRFFEILTR